MANGQTFTLPAATYLLNRYKDTALQVFYDHGDHSSQRLYSWFGATYTAPYAARHLSWVDIVVADPKTRKIHQIIEIEDSTARPKTVISDVMAVLLGDGLAFAGHADWLVGDWTCLLVFAYVSTAHAQAKYDAQLAHLQQQIVSFQSCLKTRNAAVGRILVETFKDIAELQEKIETISNSQKGSQV
jgi:hypothetical protein